MVSRLTSIVALGRTIHVALIEAILINHPSRYCWPKFKYQSTTWHTSNPSMTIFGTSNPITPKLINLGRIMII